MRRACKISVAGTLLFLFGIGPVLADCFYNGRRMPEGSRVGVLVCENGKWVQRR